MNLEILTAPSEELGQGKKITVTSIPEAIRLLERHCKKTYRKGVQRVNSFRWDCWDGKGDYQVMLSDGMHPLEYVNHEGETVAQSLAALKVQVALMKQAIPMGGQEYYRGLRDFLGDCREAAKMASTECKRRRPGDGTRHADRMARTMRRLRQSLTWAKSRQLRKGPGVGSTLAKAQWSALLAQLTAFEEALKQRYQDCFGVPYHN